MKKLAALAMFMMASCTPEPAQQPPTRAVTLQQPLPSMNTFLEAPSQVPPSRSNANMARDFLDLSFRMESGKAIPTLTRFEGPIRVNATGDISAQMLRDLAALLDRLRQEAGIDISLAPSGPAHITVEAIPQAVLQEAVPRAACFVVPRVESWRAFLSARNTPRVDWTTLKRRERAVIFVPADAAPQEVRDCLHEELAQALGPLNDLYRLPDSVFNDDNIHAVLTSFDMLMLRAYYAPELKNGMTQEEVAAQLPALLSRLNPIGDAAPVEAVLNTPRNWTHAIETALSNDVSPARRRTAAEQAISIGRSAGWTGAREGFGYYAFGRLHVGNNPARALDAFTAADAVYRKSRVTDIHSAHIAVQLAAFALSSGDVSAVLEITGEALPTARRHQNAALMATLMMFRAEALEMAGDTASARQLRLDSLAWARYGFGSDAFVAARLEEIQALRPF